MGTACSRLKEMHTISVDHGSLTPEGIYTDDTDYDITIVRSLIRKGRLAPFYRGLNEAKTNNEKIPYDNECPICFLFYPSNSNRTRCCDKSICTECFLQLRRSTTSPLVPAVCPFCVQPNLGVLYIPPPWSKHFEEFKKRRSDLFVKSKEDDDRRKWRVEANDPDVVLVDTIRPRWEEMLEERRASAVGTTRRRRVQLDSNHSGERRSRRQRQSRQTYHLDETSSNHIIYDTYATIDLEDVLIMEAIRLSLATSPATHTEDGTGSHQQQP